MMNSGQYGSGADVASTMADVTLNDGMKNGTAAHMKPADGPGKGQYEDTAFAFSTNTPLLFVVALTCHVLQVRKSGRSENISLNILLFKGRNFVDIFI